VPSEQIDITRNVRTIEWLRTELISGVAALNRGMLHHKDDMMLESLADTVIAAYLLARRLGVSFSRLEGKVAGKLRLNIDERHQIEKWYGDLTALLEHLENEQGRV